MFTGDQGGEALSKTMKILSTGGAGFIGSAVVREVVCNSDRHVANLDKLTYAGNLDSLAEARDHPRHTFQQVDICDQRELERVFTEYQPDAVVHLAAESHVDRSIEGPAEFIQTNILGTYNLLEVSRAYWNGLTAGPKERFRFLHVSTDEVYGDLGPDDPPFRENTPYAPSSPYSASKASSDHLVRAWHRTFGLPVLITYYSNNYGAYQFPEEVISLMILIALWRITPARFFECWRRVGLAKTITSAGIRLEPTWRWCKAFAPIWTTCSPLRK